jgi:hypothetical protein
MSKHFRAVTSWAGRRRVANPLVLIATTYTDTTASWLGHRDGDVYAARPEPHSVKIEGTHKIAAIAETVSREVNVAGKITVWRP